MLNHLELRNMGFMPKTKYKQGQAFPPGFRLPESCTTEIFRQLPLYINVWYHKDSVDGKHHLLQYQTIH